MNVKQEDEEGASIVEYVSEQLDLNDASLEAFADVFARFQFPPEESSVCLFISCFFCALPLIFWSSCSRVNKMKQAIKAKLSTPTTIWPPKATPMRRRNHFPGKKHARWLD